MNFRKLSIQSDAQGVLSLNQMGKLAIENVFLEWSKWLKFYYTYNFSS